MHLSAPKRTTFWIAVVLALLGFIGSVATVPVLTGIAFWLIVVGFVVLALGNLMQGL